jgi:hypothetical protein
MFLPVFFSFLYQKPFFFEQILSNIFAHVFQVVQVKIYGRMLDMEFFLNHLGFLIIYIAAAAFLVLKGLYFFVGIDYFIHIMYQKSS